MAACKVRQGATCKVNRALRYPQSYKKPTPEAGETNLGSGVAAGVAAGDCCGHGDNSFLGSWSVGVKEQLRGQQKEGAAGISLKDQGGGRLCFPSQVPGSLQGAGPTCPVQRILSQTPKFIIKPLLCSPYRKAKWQV